MHTLLDIAWRTWAVLAEMAPYLFLGFVVAGVLRVLLPASLVQRHLGGGGVGSVVKSALLGVPLPLCSCGVMPVAAGLRQQGASRGATASFLIATPQTGVDSIFATWALLGWPMAVARAVVALGLGVVSGIGADAVSPATSKRRSDSLALAPTHADAGDSPRPCCAQPSTEREAGDDPDEPSHADCHHHGHGHEHDHDHGVEPAASWWSGVRFAMVTLPRDIALPLLLGALLAGVLTAVLTPEVVAPYLGGWWAVPVVALIGLPVYICSTGVIPLALALLALGASPGAALTLMIAGPAANAATWSIAHATLGYRAALATLGTTLVGAVAVGLAVDFTGVGPWLLRGAEAHGLHAMHVTWLGHAFAIGLLVLLSQRWWPTVGRLLPRRDRAADAHPAPGTP
ncbi:MAG: SO_0444 family Cu/Zn efflux transporter [Planctomycetota bacterium]